MSLESFLNEIVGEMLKRLMEEHYSNVYSHPILSLNRCSRYLYKVSIPSLYRKVVITSPEMFDLFTKTITTGQKIAVLVSSLDLT